MSHWQEIQHLFPFHMILPAVLFWQLCVNVGLFVTYFKVKVEPGKQGLWILFFATNFFLDAFPEVNSFLSAHPLSDLSRAMIKVQKQLKWEITECDAYINMYIRGQQSTRISPMWLMQLRMHPHGRQNALLCVPTHSEKKPSVFSWLDMQKCNLT